MNVIKSFIQKQLFILKLKKATRDKKLFEFLEDNEYYFINKDGNKQYKMPEFK